ncbi:hypothetical protein RHMOL_Rhmol08G0058600 [Rhododendron molle]|uniref:Uncharacterized protein n=1 Tax=Rhododendron molle TaxID=49168 RepID=A0ACC0MK49_RHOML|nr:hypothetical protein RHMOL_Rhmol08G0058600 [Rhododendron molle]
MDGILCDELLEEVLRRLPPHSALYPHTADDVSLVSKRWLRLYRSSRSALSLRLSPDNCTPHSLSSFLSHFPRLLIAIFGPTRAAHDTSNFSDLLLSSVAFSCPPQLTHLCLQRKPVSLSPLLSLSPPHALTSPLSPSPSPDPSLSTGSSPSPLFNNSTSFSSASLPNSNTPMQLPKGANSTAS